MESEEQGIRVTAGTESYAIRGARLRAADRARRGLPPEFYVITVDPTIWHRRAKFAPLEEEKANGL